MDSITNEFEKRLIVLDLTTVIRLFDIGSDEAALYLFYCKNAKIQNTTSIYATDNFCMKGLSWGKVRFRKAKDKLKEEKLIDTNIKRDDEGKITRYYIKIHYLRQDLTSGSENHPVDGTASGSQPTNAYNKNINAIDKNDKDLDSKESSLPEEDLTPSEDELTVFNAWISRTKTISGLTAHKSITSKCPINKVDRANPKPLLLTIRDSLSNYILDDITKGINNYCDIFSSDEYWYDHAFKTLSEFLHSEKGLAQFIYPNYNHYKKGFGSVKTDPFADIRQRFKPITTRYDSKNIFDKNNNTYYGFLTEEYLKDPFYRLDDVEHPVPNFSYDTFWSLEIVIAAFLWNRSRDGNKYLNKVIELLDLWEKKKPEFKAEARRRLLE